jgi:uncharacterized membrane protein YdbT with pleckstrin-like domain
MPAIRSHFISVVMKTFKSIWYIIAAFLFSIMDMLKDLKFRSLPSASVLIGIGVFFLVILVFFIFHFLRWWKTKISIEDDTLVISRNQLSQSKTTVKLSSISTVNLQQNLFERIFNVYTLQLDINSSVTANKTDFNLVFDDKTAFSFKNYIIKYVDSLSQEKTTASEHTSKIVLSGNLQTDPEPIISFSFKNVILHCILSFSLFGALYTIGIIAVGIWAFNSSNQDLSHLLIPAILSISIATVPFIYKSVTAFLLYYDFVLRKNGDKVEVSYGLFTRRQFTLPLEKTNAIVIKQPLQARFFGLAYGEIINVGMGDVENNQSPIFCLLVKPTVLQDVIRQIAPEFVFDDLPESSPKSALIPTLIPWCFCGILAVIGFTIFYKWWIGCLILAFFLLCGYLSIITKGLKLYDDKISITTGIFEKRTITAFYSKLQNMSVEYGPISKKLGLCKGSVSILSSTFNVIGYFPTENFFEIEKNIIRHDSLG